LLISLILSSFIACYGHNQFTSMLLIFPNHEYGSIRGTTLPSIKFSSSSHSHASVQMYVRLFTEVPVPAWYNKNITINLETVNYFIFIFFHSLLYSTLCFILSSLYFLYHFVIVRFVHIEKQSQSPQCCSSRTSHSQPVVTNLELI
jgi:hypothetical protein